MVEKCILCNNDQCSVSGTTFYRLPSEPVVLKKWVEVIRRSLDDDFWDPTSSSVVCSEHFVAEDLYYGEDGSRQIKESAVPRMNMSNHNDSSVSETEISNVIKEEDCSEIEDMIAEGAKVVIKVERIKDEPKKSKKKKKKIKKIKQQDSESDEYEGLESVFDHILTPLEAKLRHELMKKNEVNQRQVTKIQNIKRQHVKLEKKIRVLQKIIETVKNDDSLVIRSGK